jgi:hypothetical protein
MEISWMSAGWRTVGIGRAGPVVAVMADGVLVRDHGDGDGHQGIKGVSEMKRLTTSIDLSTIFKDLISSTSTSDQQPDQLDLFSPDLPLHDDRASCGRPAHTYPYPSRPSSGVQRNYNRNRNGDDQLDFNHDRNHDYTNTNTCRLPGTLPRLHGSLPMRLLLLILDLSTRRPQGRKVFLHSP